MRVTRPTRTPRSGSILIIVLWVALGLVTITLYFANSMRSELRASDNRVSMLASDQAIEGAARYVTSVLLEQATNGVVPYIDDYLRAAVLVGDSHFWLIGRNNDEIAPQEPSFGLVDEASKLNLNTATLEMLEALPLPMTAELAAAIVDWRDDNSDVTSGGAEEEIYARLNPPYHCKNAPFDSVDELRLVYFNGTADDFMKVLRGGDWNRNGIIDRGHEDTLGFTGPGIMEYLTAYSREPNTRSDGTPRININASRTPLGTFLQEKFGTTRANQVLVRMGAPTRQFASILEFYAVAGVTVSEAEQIETDITTTGGGVIEGRVNVNTASAVVLGCIPGIGEDHAQDLISYRMANPDNLFTVAWVKDILGTQNATEAGPYITAQTYVFSADVAALGPFGRGYRRTHFVYDLTEGSPKIIYRQNLSHLGWALGTVVRDVWLAKATP